MSMISKQVKKLRDASDIYKAAGFPGAAKHMAKAAGTIETLSEKLEKANEELERWYTDEINEKIKNPFAYTSTLICHNCDHKDEYIEELEAEVEELKANMERLDAKKPVFKHGEFVTAVDYVDGHGEMRKDKWAEWVCPTCGWFVGEQYIPRKHNQKKCNFCSKCGQAIDWSE